MPFPTGLSPPIAKWTNLRQAIQWIAFDWLLLPEEYEGAEGRSGYLPYSNDPEDEIYNLVRRAQAVLFQVLYEGRLRAQGLLGIAKFGGKDEFHELGEIAIDHEDKVFWWSSNKYAKEYSDNPPTFWQFHTVDWNKSHAWRYATNWNENIPLEMPDKGIDYIEILVRTDDLLKVIPAGSSPIDYTIGTGQLNEPAPASEPARMKSGGGNDPGEEEPETQAAVGKLDTSAKPPSYPKTQSKQLQLEHRWDRALELSSIGSGEPNLKQIATKIAEEEVGAMSRENEKVESRTNTIRKQLGGLRSVRGWPKPNK